MEGSTAFVSYLLTPTTGFTAGDYSQAIHCNYFKKIDLGTDNPYVQEIRMNFPSIADFKFLADEVGGSGNPFGTGYTVHKIYALVQVVDNSPFDTYEEVVPDSTAWKMFDVTDQVTGSTATYITASQLTSVIFQVSLLQYENASLFMPYNLDYLNYPSNSNPDELVFGDATFFFGNVEAQIKADVYTTDISINLPLNEFNSSTNKTWDGLETVYISEIGIYDSNKNLVAIGKMNDPVAKDGTIARTVVFALDF
jgi:hypothetical protein